MTRKLLGELLHRVTGSIAPVLTLTGSNSFAERIKEETQDLAMESFGVGE